MNKEQQYWEDTQEALSRIFDRCEEIDPQSGYDMLEDIQFIRGFINKHKPRTEEQETILDKIRAEIVDTLYVDSLIFGELIDFKNGKIDADDVIEEFNRVTRMEVLRIIDKYRAESEASE